MKAGTVTNDARETAEVAVNKISAPGAALNAGRTQPPLSGRVRGSGVPHSQSAPAETAVLCNITEQTWILHRTHGAFVVAGRVPAANIQKTGRENSAGDEISAPASD